jgi:hypothetical protein
MYMLVTEETINIGGLACCALRSAVNFDSSRQAPAATLRAAAVLSGSQQ